MANTLLTMANAPGYIVKEGLMHLKNNLVAANSIYRVSEQEWTGRKPGDTINFRKPVKFKAHQGEDISAAIQDVNEQSVAMTIEEPLNVSWDFSTIELTHTVEEYSERYIKPAVMELCDQLDGKVLDLYADVANYVGTAGTTASAFTNLSAAALALDKVPAPRDGRQCIINPDGYWGIVANLTSLFIESEAREAYRNGTVKRVAGFDFKMDQNVRQHTIAGTQTTVTVNATLTKNSTLNQIALDGLDADVKVGDVFTIAGVNSVNQRSRQDTGTLQRFTATAAVSVTGSADTITFSPRIVMSDDLGPSGSPASQGQAHQNVTAYPAASGVVTFLGSHAANLAFHRNAFGLAVIPMSMPDDVVFKARESDPETGLSIRVIKQYNVLTNREVCRLDILFARKTLYPELAVRLLG